MGIQVEFNPDLALRNMEEYRIGCRKKEECIPEPLELGKTYPFLKQGQRNYWLDGEIPLLRTKGNQELSRPLAGITILEATHFKDGDEIYTRGLYRVTRVFDPNDPTIHFDGLVPVGPEVNDNMIDA
tara:strand:+ start:219 stop:599 length:381 start_codon:yes stop_codon:yes gene_type:complete